MIGFAALYTAHAHGITVPIPHHRANSSLVGNLLSDTMLYNVISHTHSNHHAAIFCHVGAFFR
jgi:hypothetical protein